MHQIQVEFVGLLPTFYHTAAHCCATDYFNVCGVNTDLDQLQDYPPEVIKNQEKVSALYYQLLHDFGEGIKPLVTGSMSVRGFWLTLKYRLGRDLAVIIDNKRVLKEPFEYPTLKYVIQEELAMRKV